MSFTLINKIYGNVAGGKYGYNVFLNKDNNIVTANNLSTIGDLYFYENSKGVWKENLFVDGPVGLGFAGYLDKDYFITSNFGSDIIYLYKRDKGNWILTDTVSFPENINFGISVSISNNTVVVGANDTPQGGEIFIYDIVENKLVFKQSFSGNTAGEKFGASVAIDKNYLVASSMTPETNPGKITIYEKEKDLWVEKKIFNGENTGEDDNYGYNVSISGNYCATIASSFGENQKLYIYEKIDGEWELTYTYLDPDGAKTTGLFNYTELSISKNYLSLGYPLYDTSRGKVVIFKREKEWKPVKTIIAGNEDSFFGGSTSFSNDYLSIGAPTENNIGASYIYRLD